MKNALWLLKTQWGAAKLGFAITIAIYAFYGGLAGYFSNQWFYEVDRSAGIFMDIFLFIFMSCNGFIMNKTYISNSYWKTDTFRVRLSGLRALPIPVESLALSRLLQVVIISPILTVAFFIPFYGVSDWAQSMHLMSWIGFVLVWFAFGTVSSGCFLLMEWAVSGKSYMLGSICFALVVFIVGGIISSISEQTLSVRMVEVMQGVLGWVWPVLAIAAAALIHVLLQYRLRSVLCSRDLV